MARSRFVLIVAVVVLVGLLAVPSLAFAGNGCGAKPTLQERMDARGARLLENINAAGDKIDAHIAKVTAKLDPFAAAGVDIYPVQMPLMSASAHVINARSLASDAASVFSSVAGSADPASTLAYAESLADQARAEIDAARVSLDEARAALDVLRGE